jgi:hypothetical protein
MMEMKIEMDLEIDLLSARSSDHSNQELKSITANSHINPPYNTNIIRQNTNPTSPAISTIDAANPNQSDISRLQEIHRAQTKMLIEAQERELLRLSQQQNHGLVQSRSRAPSAALSQEFHGSEQSASPTLKSASSLPQHFHHHHHHHHHHVGGQNSGNSNSAQSSGSKGVGGSSGPSDAMKPTSDEIMSKVMSMINAPSDSKPLAANRPSDSAMDVDGNMQDSSIDDKSDSNESVDGQDGEKGNTASKNISGQDVEEDLSGGASGDSEEILRVKNGSSDGGRVTNSERSWSPSITNSGSGDWNPNQKVQANWVNDCEFKVCFLLILSYFPSNFKLN